MSKIVFLTFNDYPGGIFSGQVIDVCRFLASQGADVDLLSFVSLRSFFKTTRLIRRQYAQSSTLYMSPGVHRWKKNLSRLKRRIAKLKPDTIVARGPFAAWLAIECRNAGLVKRVVFDGRGAYDAEFKEYNVAHSEALNDEIRSVEEAVVTKSDFRIGVSQALIDYWKREFGYTGSQHVVIPCTLRKQDSLNAERNAIRRELGYNENDIVIVYSGSFAGWQSFGMMDEVGGRLLEKNPAVKFLVLAPATDSLKIVNKFPGRVRTTWLSAEDVPRVLAACDYGWLVRENSVTNQVASPVKFAEYLNYGLPVIISPGLGDFSAFVAQHNCGIVITTYLPELTSLSEEKSSHNRSLAASYFIKEKYAQQYKMVAG